MILPSRWYGPISVLRTSLKSVFMAAANSTKLLVVLHGRGDSYEGFLWLAPALDLNLNVLLVNAPDRYYMGYSWYDLPPNQRPGVLRSSRELECLFDEIGQQGFRSQDTVLFGFSQGCLMALEWGGRTQRSLSGYIGISGYCLDAEALLRERSEASQASRWLITHGRQDEVLPFAKSEAQMRVLSDAGWPLDFRAFDKTHTIDQGSELALIRSWLISTLGLGSSV